MKNRFLNEWGFKDPVNLPIIKKFKQNEGEKMKKEIKDEIEFWMPEKIGDKLEGTVVGTFMGKFGVVTKIKNNDKVFGTPSHNVLQSKMAQVPIGSYVWIELVDIKDTDKGNPMRVYKVEYEESKKE